MRRGYNLDSAQQLEFGKHIKSLRLNSHKTQSEVAEDVGVSVGYISTLESGTRNPPTVHVLEKLAKSFKVSEKDLKAAAGYFNEDKIGNLDKDRIDWGFQLACKDPIFEFGKSNIYKPMSLETKVFIIELYEKATGRKILTTDEVNKSRGLDE
jgi:transcriptional regulator with XRE-family HTH domain